jgi:hypothetical protein
VLAGLNAARAGRCRVPPPARFARHLLCKRGRIKKSS